MSDAAMQAMQAEFAEQLDAYAAGLTADLDAHFAMKGSAPMSNDFEIAAKVVKVNEELGIVMGWAIVCKQGGRDYYDLQDDHIPEDAMLKAATDFMASARISGDMHARDDRGAPIADGQVLFAFPMTTEIAKAFGVTTKTTGLMIAMKPTPAVLAKYKSGDYTGFSIGGARIRNEEVA